MVRLVDIEISKARLAGRIIYGLFWAGLTLFFFYYLPTHFNSLVGPYVPQAYAPAVHYVAQSISNSPLPFLGVALAALAFVEIILKGTWIYGAILIVTGIFWLLFDITLFSRGLLFANLLPSTIIQNYHLAPGTISAIVWILVIMVVIFVISSLFTIGRGISVIVNSRRRARERQFAAQRRYQS